MDLREERTTDVMASTNERRWPGGTGARMSTPGPALLLKSKGPNNCIFHLGTFGHPALLPPLPFCALVVFRPCPWSLATSVPLHQHQSPLDPPPRLRQLAKSPDKHTRPERIPRSHVRFHSPTLKSYDKHHHVVRTHHSPHPSCWRRHNLSLRPCFVPFLTVALVPTQALSI